MTRSLKLSDGRTLTYDEYGDPAGVPVIFNHGFSDSHVIRHPDDALTASLGVRWISADQPGVGGSTPSPGRRMVDWGADMAQLADELGLERFHVAGHSGGGPHALSIARRLPDRVAKVVLASPVAPFDHPGVTGMLVMKDLKSIARIRRFGFLLRFAMKAAARQVNGDVHAYVGSIGGELPQEAETVLRNPEQRALFEENFRIGYEQGSEGVLEMTLALWGWGFEPGEVRPPVEVFYGNRDGIISPRMPVYLAEKLPSATTHEWDGANHYGFVDRERWAEFVTAARGEEGAG